MIVIGALNTDIIASGVPEWPHPNGTVYGGRLIIGPGGKSRNIAAMAGVLSVPGTVAMIGRTAQDSYGLWKSPVDALKAAGVNINHVKILKPEETDKFPAVALLAVNEHGDNQCYVLPGVSDDFSESDIDEAHGIFESTAQNQGIFALTLECPTKTAKHAIDKANGLGIRIVLDPGGVVAGQDMSSLLKAKPFLLKPNEHEARIMTGIEVTDFESARQAADKLRGLGAGNVLLTHGEHGAYLFTDQGSAHIPIPDITAGEVKDVTGCGDQAMAALCAYLQAGKTLEEAAKVAVLAGTLQFYKSGIQPITKQELEARL